MAIPSVMHGLIELDGGKVFELDSPKGAAWLESIGSFRFEPAGDNKPYTVRKEAGKGGDYWYGYRKVVGRLHKKYIGKSSEVSTAKLEEIAEALNTPPQPRVTDKVTEVTDRSERVVTEQVTDKVTIEEFTALKSQVQLMQETLEALRSELPGKLDVGDFEELPIVTDGELQIELGNLKVENEALRVENAQTKSQYLELLETSASKIKGLQDELLELRSQFQAAPAQSIPDLKTAYEGYKREKKPGRSFTISELRPFYAAILKGSTPNKGN